MSLDQQKIGEVTAKLMDVLDQQELPDDAQIGAVCLIAEINWPDGSQVTAQVSDPRIQTNLGLLELTKAQLMRQLDQN